MSSWIEIDGAQGEGGGQVLRTSLSLSAITGRPIRIRSIRARRRRPGLMRQHLTAVRAAAKICSARVRGDALNSTTLEFEPGRIDGGEYQFAVGTAGSTTLILQTVLWPLLFADQASTVVVEGGTHNPMAPPFDFMARSFGPAIRQMGAQVTVELLRCGFYPAGGGSIRMTVQPAGSLRPVTHLERGPLRRQAATAIIANLPASVARRELNALHQELRWRRSNLTLQRTDSDGPGNALVAELTYGELTTVVTAFGEKGKPAEDVAREAVATIQRFEHAQVPVDEHLADQLLIGMALAGSGRMLTSTPTQHTRTNADIIAKFLPIETSIAPHEGPAWTISVATR